MKREGISNAVQKREKVKEGKETRSGQQKMANFKDRVDRRKDWLAFADHTLLRDVQPLQAGLVSSFGKSRQT